MHSAQKCSHYYKSRRFKATMHHPAIHVSDGEACIVNNQHIVRLQGRSGQNKETCIVKI